MTRDKMSKKKGEEYRDGSEQSTDIRNNYFQFMIKCVIYKLFSVVQYKQETLVYTALITVAKPQE